jgi:CBS domain-containing protein
MRTDVVTIPYSAPLSEIERIFADHRVSGAPVVDEAGRIVGVVSVRDLIERYAEDPDSHPRRGHGFYELADEADPEEVAESFEVPEEAEETAEDVMTAQVLSVPVDAPLRRIAREMRRHRVHRLLVVEGGKHVGIVSSTEVLDALAR